MKNILLILLIMTLSGCYTTFQNVEYNLQREVIRYERIRIYVDSRIGYLYYYYPYTYNTHIPNYNYTLPRESRADRRVPRSVEWGRDRTVRDRRQSVDRSRTRSTTRTETSPPRSRTTDSRNTIRRSTRQKNDS